jgi:hypothetical protein
LPLLQDLILAVLKEDEEILLAFNSSQVPPLLPGTKQNIFSPALHLTQQQQQQQQRGGGATEGQSQVKQDPGGYTYRHPMYLVVYIQQQLPYKAIWWCSMCVY